jgi:cellulose biosynthesis protein BcsQ
MTFDDVLPTLVRVCEKTPGFVDLNRCCIVRDLTGRVRLLIDPATNGSTVDLDALTRELKRELWDYFAAPIWSTAATRQEEKRLAGAIFNQSRTIRWPEAAYDDLQTGVKGVLARSNWYKFERRLSKHEWLESNDTLVPWALGNGPAIVTFYSFKGGVGRTTTLMACAWQLARAGQRVIVIDLDLEAPGVGLALGAKAQRGVVDFLVDHLATKNADLDGCVVPADELGPDKNRVLVVPAGNLGPKYLEKLARLDFMGASPHAGPAHSDASPIEDAMRVLLKKLKTYSFSTGQPGSGRETADYIFIDARAGLHDLAGLSLHRLAHVDVLSGRTSEQGYVGLELALATLVQRKGQANCEPLIVQTMVPVAGTREALAEEAEFLDKSFSWFKDFVYGAQAATVRKDDNTQAHWPSVIRYEPARARFATLLSVERHFLAEDYEQLVQRIIDRCTPAGGP